MAEEKRILGCIADDFTGASDAASFLQKAGLETILLNGVPGKKLVLKDYDAVVIALKTRTEPVAEAVAHAMEAVKWLEENGATNYYLKYCSTFDSTRDGNIGPVLDAVLEYFKQPYTLLCPALPVNGRTVRNGHLYVNDIPLHKSPMKDHPLTPMWDSEIKKLMEAQSKYQCTIVGRQQLEEENRETIIEGLAGQQTHFYLIPDYQDEEDAKNIVRLFGHLKVLSGGSGILQYLITKEERGIILAGSCSKATLNQIEQYQKAGHASYKIDPVKLLEKHLEIEEILAFIASHPKDYVLIYSSDTADQVRAVQKYGKEEIAQLLEETISELAKILTEQGYQHIIAAGGETSGAITKKLGYYLFEVGKSAAPGVPVLIPVEDRQKRLILKSGNFGDPDFFAHAVKIVKGEA